MERPVNQSTNRTSSCKAFLLFTGMDVNVKSMLGVKTVAMYAGILIGEPSDMM
jgi:hypothetical protein